MEVYWSARLKQVNAVCLLCLGTASQQEVQSEQVTELKNQIFYQEGKEVACFGSVEELADKIQHYLAHPEERDAIARAGHARCVPAYSYDNRIKEILRYHEGASSIHPELAAVGN